MKSNLAEKLFRFIMKSRNTAIYRMIYNHPRIFISILVAIAVVILYIFINFVFTYVIVL